MKAVARKAPRMRLESIELTDAQIRWLEFAAHRLLLEGTHIFPLGPARTALINARKKLVEACALAKAALERKP